MNDNERYNSQLQLQQGQLGYRYQAEKPKTIVEQIQDRIAYLKGQLDQVKGWQKELAGLERMLSAQKEP